MRVYNQNSNLLRPKGRSSPNSGSIQRKIVLSTSQRHVGAGPLVNPIIIKKNQINKL